MCAVPEPEPADPGSPQIHIASGVVLGPGADLQAPLVLGKAPRGGVV